MFLAAGAAILVTALFAAFDCFFNKPVGIDIPHVPKPPLPNSQPPKRLPPIFNRAVSIPHSSGAVEVGLLLYFGTADRVLIIAKIDSGNADYNKRRADELVDAINKSLNYARQ